MVPGIAVNTMEVEFADHLVVSFQQLDEVVVAVKQDSRNIPFGVKSSGSSKQSHQLLWVNGWLALLR